MTISHRLAAIAAISMAAGIALGAFGAHGLKELISEKYQLVFETGVKYQMYSSLGLLFLSLFGDAMRKPALLILAGMCIFSFSLYLLSMNEIWDEGLRRLGAITPLGGVLMIAGWIWAASAIYKRRS